MEIKRKFLILFCLLLGGVVVTDPVVLGASKSSKSSKNAKRANSKSKSKKKDNKKKDNKKKSGGGSSSASSDAARAAVAATAAAAARTAAAAKVNTQVTITDANVLSDYYRACLVSACKDGSVDWAGCFKESSLSPKITSCKSTVANAYVADETVHNSAQNIVKNIVKKYFHSMCEENGGTVTSEDMAICTWNICYKAKSADGKHESSKECKPFKLGQVVSCNAGAFGVGDIEYKEEMTSEQKMAMLQAGITLATDAISVVGQAVDYAQKSKELKRKEHYIADGWYKFDGKTLEIISDKTCATYEYNGTGYKDKEADAEVNECNGACEKITDKNGLIAIRKFVYSEGNKDYYKFCLEKKTNSSASTSDILFFSDSEKACSDMKSSMWKTSGGTSTEPTYDSCYVLLQEKTELEKLEKANELARSTGYLEHLEGESKRAQRTLAIREAVAVGAETEVYQQAFGGSSGDCKECNINMYDVFPTCPSGTDDSSTVSDGVDAKNICFKAANGRKSVKIKSGSSTSTSEYECVVVGDKFKCIKVVEPDLNGATEEAKLGTKDCKWNSSLGKFCHDGSNGGGYLAQLNKMNTSTNGNNETDLEKNLASIDDFIQKNKTYSDKVSEYSSAVSSYQSNQNSVNESKKQIEDLKNSQSTALQNMIGTGTQSLMSNGVTMITTAMAAGQNKGTMVGHCYFGDPDAGASPFLEEGTSKKLEWKLFN